MKYGESVFDIIYLGFALFFGIYLLIKAKSKAGKTMGIASLVLGGGDAFHLIPRVLNYFIPGDFSLALGVGKLVTSISMTIFYLILFYIWIIVYKEKYNVYLSIVITVLVLVRIILCAFPQNGWFNNSFDLGWTIGRNVPFLLLGAIIAYLFFKNRKDNKYLYPLWIYIILSFAFYIPVAIGASYVSILGMLMLPKTVCYILMIVSFILLVKKSEKE